MVDDRLSTYRGMRDAARTPEPGVGPENDPDVRLRQTDPDVRLRQTDPDVRLRQTDPLPEGDHDTFVIQEHHARRLHWDFRLERGGVLVSWALPKGVPDDPATNHLAVHTEDHPMEYAAFAGEIPKGEYGGGRVEIWDRGTYETEKWTDREVKVVLRGSRVSGRYVLFRTRGKDWMIHRMDPPVDPDATPPPALTGADRLVPVHATTRPRLPRDDGAFGFEFAWGGRRVLVYTDRGSVRAADGAGETVTDDSLRGLADDEHRAVLDGEIADLDGTPSYLIFDLLYLDGRWLGELPYWQRRERLDELAPGGRHALVAPWFTGGGAAIAATAAERGLPGVVAKRLDAPYDQAKADWRLILSKRG
jgi:bifunctional non-homologous end joining protein LigD